MMPDVKCGNCKVELDEDYNTPKNQRKPCPKCGSLSRCYHVHITDTIVFHDKLGIKARHNSGGKPFFESVGGSDLHRKSGKWMKLERTIDRERNHYREVVIDPKTGEIVHFCEEPLTEHQGHGTAKRDKK